MVKSVININLNDNSKINNNTNKTFTYQTRLNVSEHVDNLLSLQAKLLSKVQRKLYADYRCGKNIIKQKNEYLSTYGITARQFNSIRIILQGKIDSVLALQAEYIANTKDLIKKTEKKIKLLNKKNNNGTITSKQSNALHQYKRKLTRLNIKLNKLEYDKKNKIARICFGSKSLFKKQFNLEANNIKNHQEWLDSWKNTRDNQFYLVGSRDETMGNQSCVTTMNDDGSFNFRIRIPNSILLSPEYSFANSNSNSKFIEIKNVVFAYGHDNITKAVQNNIKRNNMSKKNNRVLHGDIFKQYGQSLNFRFLRDDKGWRVFITTEVDIKSNPMTESKVYGAIGVDINANHLAIAEVNDTGNLINSFTIPCNTYSKTTEQAKAVIGDCVKQLVNYAVLKNKPLVIEKLDFRQKKRDLASNNNKPKAKSRARTLSSFSYNKIISFIKSRAYRNAIAVHSVNAAYTSIIGRVKFASIYTKLSVHTSAAMVIARRYLGYSEQPPRSFENVKVPNDKGFYVTLPELVKIRGKHIWSSWALVRKNLMAALAEQFQMMRSNRCKSLLTTGDDDIPF